ncbi:Fe2+-dependent dioxygenase [Roseomonas haemaphysalidis]|uniref:Fe2+-dependent dioxygenase n=1 Tax=Roseomonas haemaphysalidis TaxID=2768162 RepID=A0ABS3KNE5_9PROT|nr:Fe2+-dependent dioxygenase [Roseomonas haemaphysalidis]MBO1078991.1 Fe2+-dependent dioxygenase [Roseomonas haemaphysalidis]
MLIRIPQLLSPDEVAHCRTVLEAAEWTDGRATAGEQSALAKFNLQVPEASPQARQLGELVLRALGRNAEFTAAALPLRVYPPMFNRYDAGMTFRAHVDNAIRHVPGGGRLRTDVSSTLFLSPPGDYDGGELVIEDTYGTQSIKLDAGDLVLYPATSLHSVRPVTRGSRWASFFWIQSMVKDDGRRGLLYGLDQGIRRVRAQLPDDDAGVLALTASYHNLLRQWVEM